MEIDEQLLTAIEGGTRLDPILEEVVEDDVTLWSLVRMDYEGEPCFGVVVRMVPDQTLDVETPYGLAEYFLDEVTLVQPKARTSQEIQFMAIILRDYGQD